MYEYDLAGRINGITTRDRETNKMQAYESIRYNDGKGTVKSKIYNIYGTDGQLIRQTPYSFTYGDPAKGEIPDTLYKFETGGGSYSYAYDSLARLESRTLTLGDTVKTESYTYAANPANSAFTTPLVSSMTDLAGKTHTYTYDANGNILTDTYDGNTVSYEYDSLNRMTRYNDPVLGRTYVYVYDDRGNITEMQDHSYTTGALSAYYSSCEYEYGDSTWADLMTSYWGEEITYDELGNPLNWINGETLTWQNGRRLASVDGVTYGYNADGLRVSKTWALGSTEYYVVDGQYIGEKTVKNGTQYFITYTYDENGSPAGINVNGTQYWFVKNLQGDVTAILDSNGAVAANYRYDAYGYIISITNGSGANVGLTDAAHIARLNPFRYRGYMYDEETGYYYVSSRYYEPYIGRFLNADTTNILTVTPNGLTDKNLFSYCDGNPVMRVDHGGEFWDTIFDVITLGASIVEVCISPDDPWAWAGLAGDVLDLVPFVTGVGEVTKAVKTTIKVIDKTDDVIDVAKTTYKLADATSDIRKATGSYEIMYKSGKNYIGKGGFKRAITSAERNAIKYADEVTSIKWKSAPSKKAAFIDEYLMQKRNGGVLSSNRDLPTYNKIWSPGRKYYSE